MSFLSRRHGWTFEYIEGRFTYDMVDLLYYLNIKDERDAEERIAKTTAGNLALIFEKAGLLQRM